MVNILVGGPQRGCKSEKLSPALYMEREVAKVFPNDPSWACRSEDDCSTAGKDASLTLAIPPNRI
jgi:hypothetical protein